MCKQLETVNGAQYFIDVKSVNQLYFETLITVFAMTRRYIAYLSSTGSMFIFCWGASVDGHKLVQTSLAIPFLKREIYHFLEYIKAGRSRGEILRLARTFRCILVFFGYSIENFSLIRKSWETYNARLFYKRWHPRTIYNCSDVNH